MKDVVEQNYLLRNVQIDEQKVLGYGTHTYVFEVTYMGLKCAGKRIYDYVIAKDSDVVKRFIQECRLLSKVRHPNLVQFLGVYYQEGMRAPILVMEFLPTNLTSCIEQYGILPKEISYSILHDVAMGLQYLHYHAIIHRNLYSNKILITSNMRAKITDIGMATFITKISRKWTKAPGNPSFMAPEINVATPKYSPSVDIFSFGVIMIHVLCGEEPRPNRPPMEITEDGQIIAVSEADRRKHYLQRIKTDHPGLIDLIQKCIAYNPKHRPKLDRIVEELELCIQPDTFHEHLSMLNKVLKLKQPGK